MVDHDAHHTLEIGRGMPEEHEIVYEGEADESPDWEAGDVILRIRSRKEHGGWKRKESSLYWKETIGIDEVCFSLLSRTLSFVLIIGEPRHCWVSTET